MEQQFLSNWNIQMKKGLVLFLVMNIIKNKSCYGYEIIQKIKTDTGMCISEGTLYPLLKKLKQDQLVLFKWDVNDEQAPRKYYYLTGRGNSMLKEMNSHWFTLNQSVSNMIIN